MHQRLRIVAVQCREVGYSTQRHSRHKSLGHPQATLGAIASLQRVRAVTGANQTVVRTMRTTLRLSQRPNYCWHRLRINPVQMKQVGRTNTRG
jgi:hypothetical protein